MWCYDPGLDGVIINNVGSKLLGIMYLAVDSEPHPTAVLLHDIPGLEKNTDIAYALRDAGWNTLIFHYRGCWGSEGDYTLAGMPDDVRSAIDTIANGDFPVDVNRLAAIGHGLGGWAAIVAASRDPRIRAVVTLGGVSNLRTVSLTEECAADYALFLHNITGKGIQSQWRALGATYNPVDIVSRLEMCPILILHGTADKLVPASQAHELKQGLGDGADLVLIQGADHTFSRHRKPLVDTIVPWLHHKL